MKLTGKCKEDFDKWYLQWVFNEKTFLSLRFSSEQILENWNSLHQSEKYGVYVDFFDSVGIYVMDKHNEVARRFYYDISTKPMSNDITSECNLTRPQARAAAIEKANEIYNSKI